MRSLCAKMAFSIPPSVLALIAVVAFSLAPVGRAAAPEEYFPLKVGHEWIMDVTYTSPDGEVQKATGRRKIEGQVERAGKTWFRARTSIEGGPMPVSYLKLIRKDETGVHSILEQDPKATEQTEIKLPVQVGETWERKSGNTTFKDTVVDLTIVQIGEKIYQGCYHFRTQSDRGGGYTEDFWEAPGVGAIKSTISFTNGGRIDLVLREFRPGGE